MSENESEFGGVPPMRLGNRDQAPAEQGKRKARTAVLYTDEEWAAIVAAAAIAGMRPGAFVAQSGFDAAYRKNTGIELDRDQVNRLIAELLEYRRVLANIGGNVNQLAAAANSTGEIGTVAEVNGTLQLLRRVVLAGDEMVLRIHAELLP
ncbi:hypothetical protein D5S17_35740 [Pseudonocardiaceae bacterium YIM PH 21723]|nr:hypothetical protein D5S17_35740 [Pseudonocardiaceae bacterium YIM PH 21723]